MKKFINYAASALTIAAISCGTLTSCSSDEPTKEQTASIDKVINLVPLMTIAGDHSHNDMAGVLEEGDSWREQLAATGYKCTNENCYQIGLGDYPSVQEIWINHLKEAMAGVENATPMAKTAEVNYTDPEAEIFKFTKTSNTAILLVTFGSTMEGPHETYKKEVAAFKKEFPNADILMAFTSPLCISRWYQAKKELFAQPYQYFAAFKALGYENVYVQSLHATKGVEFNGGENSEGTLHGLKNYYQEFVTENPNVKTCLGLPLLSSEADIEAVGDILYNEYKDKINAGEALILMGHGNEEDADSPKNTAKTYLAVEKYLQAKNNDIYLGTVDCETVSFDRVLTNLNKKYISAE